MVMRLAAKVAGAQGMTMLSGVVAGEAFFGVSGTAAP